MGKKAVISFALVVNVACATVPPVVEFSPTPDVTDVCSALTEPPPHPPAIKPEAEQIRVLAFGDFGDEGSDQMAVARAMVRYDESNSFDFGLTLGDNFYPRGLADPTDRRWVRRWENPYNPLGIRVYATLGNHDHDNPASPGGEIRRSQHSQSWCLPRHFYTYTAGPVQFFALDTDPIHRADPASQAQLDWLKRELAASQARWKVVYGHHPLYSTGSEHGSETQPIRNALLPLLSDKVDVSLAGHDHNMEYLKPEKGVHFFVSGAGGHNLRVMGPDPENRSLWALGETGGFTVLEADENTLTIRFFDIQQTELCAVQLAKGQPTKVINGCK